MDATTHEKMACNCCLGFRQYMGCNRSLGTLGCEVQDTASPPETSPATFLHWTALVPHISGSQGRSSICVWKFVGRAVVSKKPPSQLWAPTTGSSNWSLPENVAVCQQTQKATVTMSPILLVHLHFFQKFGRKICG